MPHLAYVDFPKQITNTSLGILKYSTVLAKTKLFGGIIQLSAYLSMNDSSEKFLGSTNALLTFVKTLNSSDTLAS